MKVTEPLHITEAMLAHSSIAEPAPGEPAVWTSGTAYRVGQRVTRTQTHRIYECVKDVQGRAAATPESAADLWKDMGPTARWNMFALDRNTPSTSSDPIHVRIKVPGRIDTVGLFGVRGRSVLIVMRDSAGAEVYRHETSMVRRISMRWSDYFFGGFDAAQVESLLRFDLPPVPGATLEVTVSGGAGPYGLAALVIGKSYYIGAAQYNAQSDALNFSRMDRQADGTTILLPRRNVPRVDIRLVGPAELTPLIYALRPRLLGKVVIWSGLDDHKEHPYFEPVLSLGFARRWQIDLAYPRHILQTLEIEDF